LVIISSVRVTRIGGLINRRILGAKSRKKV